MPNSGIQKLSGENEMVVGTAVSFFVGEGDDKKPADGEIIGIKDEIATVVYISPSGEYSIDKFDKSKLKIKGEEDSENLETNNTNTKIDTEEIEETDLEAEKLILEEEEKENRRLDKIKEVKIQKIKNALISIPKNELTKNILKKINIILEELHFSLEPFQQIQSIDELSDEDIEILSEDLDFINELMFISFIDFSIANKKEKPSQLHIKEIKTRITHFDTQAKKLRDKRIEEFNQNLYTQRTEDEKKYPNPLKMMNIGELTDQKANQLKIDPKHQKIFNKILYREKQKRDEFSNNLVKKIVERRKDLIHLLKSENQSESDNKSKFLKIIPELHSILLPIQESENIEENNKNLASEEIHKIVYKELLELEDNKTENLEETKNLEQLNNIQQIAKYIQFAMETPFQSIAGIQQFGEKEGLQTLIFKQISSIINVALWAKQFSTEKNIDTNITKETIKTSIQLYGKAFLTNFIKPSNNTNSENIQNLTDILSNTAISFFDDLQNNTTEVAIDTLKTNFLQKFPDIIKKIIPLELKKDDIVIYTDESGTKHEATILSISKNLVLTDPKYHIAISINGNPKILSTEKNSKEISQLKLK
jgi:hypothetical protein